MRLLPAALLSALFAAVGVWHVASRVVVVRAGYRLSQLTQENEALSREHDRLKLELATLKSPQRLEKLARERLAMGAPAPGAVIRVSPPSGGVGEGRESGVRRAAAGFPRTLPEGGMQHVLAERERVR